MNNFLSRHRLRLAAVSGLLALLSACGGGGGSSAGGDPGTTAGPLASDYFPTDTGAVWIYDTGSGTQPDVVRMKGTQTVDGHAAQVFETTSGADGSVARDLFVIDADGVRDFAPSGSDALTQALSGLKVIPASLAAGNSQQQADKTIDAGADLDGDGRNESLRLQALLRVIGTETVSTPAGSFPQALHVRQELTLTMSSSRGLAPVVEHLQSDDWYAPGIGLVSNSTRIWYEGYDQTSTSQLSGYKVGARTSATSPLALVTTTPAAGSTSGAPVSLLVTMSRPIDPASVGAATLIVTDSEHVRIPGTVTVAGSTLTFTAGGAWASGSYTAQLTSDVTDLLGTALPAAQSWTFTIDATAPRIVSMTPAAGSQNVATGTSIVLSYSETVDPKSVDASLVRITSFEGEIASTIAVSGNTVTLTPTQPLQPGKTYQVSAWGVTDMAGNRMSDNFTAQIQTSQGRFAYPTELPGMPVGANMPAVMAVGDVNGDGLKDVLAATWGSLNGSLDGLYFFAGRADGTLAPAAKIDLGPQLMRCEITSIAVGDVNQDGRTDVVVSGNYCGAQVLHQAADGSLVPAEFLGQASSSVVRIVDIDGQGRPALIGVGGPVGNVGIWRPDAGGTLRLSETVPISASATVRDVAVGDVNGDGRLDLIAAVSEQTGHNVALMLRQADGSFAAPEYLSTGSVWGAAAIAVGDLNGDQRADIVATTGGNSPTSIAVFYQAAGGTMGPATQVSTYDSPMAVTLADIDGDGRLDIVVSHVGWSAVGVYLQHASGLLGAEKRYAAPYGNFMPGQLAVGDFNNDGLPDVAIAGNLIAQLPDASAGASSATRLRAAAAAALVKHLRARGLVKPAAGR